MKLKDLVANSLPRVRGRKSKKATHLHPSNHVPSKHEPEFSTHAPYFMQHQHPAFESRESSVERSSTVAVVDAPWREGAAYTTKADKKHIPPCDMGLVTQSMTYYTPVPHQQHGMVMSHSADGISAQAMLLASPRDYVTGSKVTSLSDHYAMTGYQHPNMTATSETAVNYVGPNYVYHSQHQHQHHHHHHSHDHHYVYHHHHHDRQQYHPQQMPPLIKPDPLTERNFHQNYTATNSKTTQQGAEKPRKPESGGFLRKSFASFRAMRKPGSRNKEKDSRINSQVDENDKCLICPYPQPQTTDKCGSHKKSSKQSKKEMKSLMKSMKNKHNSAAHEKQSDGARCTDNDSKMYNQSHYHCQSYDAVPCSAMNTFPVRECSMESSISRHTVAGSRERVDQQYFETASLSGYDSDVTKNRSGRSRSRIKTNPWLPSPQPSLTMGRRFENRQTRDSSDVMDDESPGCFPRSASFDYHSQLGVSTFLSSGSQSDHKRNIQRHRSLTPVDLKLNLSLPRTKKSESPKPPDAKSQMNDLNTNLTKSRPNSIISPNSEFVALADNIEQLANNISFEYEDSLDKSLQREATPRRETTATKEQCARSSEESNSKKRKSESSPPLPTDNVSDSAHSPDSGIGCLGSCDGDDSMTLGNTITLEQSPTVSIPSSHSTNSDSLNSTPKRKTLKNSRQAMDGKSTKRFSSFLSSQCNDNHNNGLEMKDDNPKPISDSLRDGLRMPGSSSSESIASVVISESDIDNTSYKFMGSGNLNHCKESAILMDPCKPQNVTPCLMVDERLDINFRSLPRKLNGKQARSRCENDGRFTISRSRNVILENECPPSLILFPSDEKSSALSLTQVTRSRNGNGEGNYEKIGSRLDGVDHEGECEMAVNFVNLDQNAYKPDVETGDSVTMDTVDACVQTDFLLDTWERKQPSGLSPLDDSFDPVESTRRWLISGNMQGSADTGYSSQPRDSHVFMEEEVAFLQLETLSDASGHSAGQSKAKTASNNTSSCRGKLSPLECESMCSCSGFNQGASVKEHKSDSRCQSLTSTENERDRNAAFFSECALSNLLYGLKPPYENDFDDTPVVKNGASNNKSQVNKRQKDEIIVPNSDVSKRHSSDSSTSTLTSDIVVLDKDNDNITINLENFNNNSFLCHSSRQMDDSDILNSRKDMSSDDYHDYVNLPVRFFGAKSQSKVPVPNVNDSDLYCVDGCLNDKVKYPKNKFTDCCLSSKQQPHNKSSTYDSSHKIRATSEEKKKCGTKGMGKNNQFRYLESSPNYHVEDRPDYLEFLKDAPLHQPQSTANQVFIVPGFGPLEVPKGSFRNGYNLDERKSLSPDCAKKSSNTSKSTKPKKEDRPTNLKLLSHNCSPQSPNNENHQNGFSTEQNKKDAKGQCVVPYINGKRKPHKDSTSKPDRCPTVRSYDVDDFAPINRVDLTSYTSSSSTSRKDRAGSTRNLAERVALLRREKEIIYRKIQEVQQQQEMDRQREQFQQHRHLHSQRKDELLETLRILKEKLEEQSKTLHMKCREEI